LEVVRCCSECPGYHYRYRFFVRIEGSAIFLRFINPSEGSRWEEVTGKKLEGSDSQRLRTGGVLCKPTDRKEGGIIGSVEARNTRGSSLGFGLLFISVGVRKGKRYMHGSEKE